MEEYQNWKYDCRSDGKCFKFEVFPSEKMMEPASFFKYYALNSYSIEALTGCYVYATHPNKFNDSIDCNSQILNFQNASKKTLKLYMALITINFWKYMKQNRILKTIFQNISN